MAKPAKTQYSCQSCGHNSTKWLGRCPSCGEWNAFVEEVVSRTVAPELTRGLSSGSQARNAVDTFESWSLKKDVSSEDVKRIDCKSSELNRVLGGGLVPDSFVLIGGDPGVGKSTLLLQTAHKILEAQKDARVLYASGEESVSQIGSRAERLQVTQGSRLFLLSETNIETLLQHVESIKPTVLVVDSLQTFSSDLLESVPGSVSQVREIASRLMVLAKSKKIAVFLVGHVTKEGSIAGPKTVEHMVDTVLYFEGDSSQNYRILRGVKNRFGSSREIGIFEMDGEGLREVTNPSELFLTERSERVSGTAVCASQEGTRTLLTEVQALCAYSTLAIPRRTSVGIETSRASLLAAVLERHLDLKLSQRDLFINVVGGLKLSETSSDLSVMAAILSSYSDVPSPVRSVFIGECGLTGEIRPVPLLQARIEEAHRLGFEKAYVSSSVHASTRTALSKIGLHITALDHVRNLGGLFS